MELYGIGVTLVANRWSWGCESVFSRWLRGSTDGLVDVELYGLDTAQAADITCVCTLEMLRWTTDGPVHVELYGLDASQKENRWSFDCGAVRPQGGYN